MGTWEGLFVSVTFYNPSSLPFNFLIFYIFIFLIFFIFKYNFVTDEKYVCSAFAAGLNNGGASGLLYGYLFAWTGTVTQVLILAELGSMYVFLKKNQTPPPPLSPQSMRERKRSPLYLFFRGGNMKKKEAKFLCVKKQDSPFWRAL